MKFIFGLTILFSVTGVFAESLKPDFSCVAKNKSGETFEVKISDVDFAKEVSISKGKKSCQFQISYAQFNERSVAPLMVVEFTSATSCAPAKNFKFLQEGFLKVHLDRKEAYVLALYDHQTLPCEMREFNKKKLSSRFRSSGRR